MLATRDIRALDGANWYDLAPVALVRYVGSAADGVLLADQVATLAYKHNIPFESPLFHEPSSLDERAITWRTSTPETLALLIEHIVNNDPSDIDEVLDQLRRERIQPEYAGLFERARELNIPMLKTADGWRLGYGARSIAINDPAADWDHVGRIPIVAISGTNGKTTTTRLIDHTLRSTGMITGRTDTDGIWLNGAILEAGDWTGFGGSQAILSNPHVQVAVLEVARGGLLRRGLAFDRCDVAVLTNVSEDHLPDRGVGTVAEMARAKGTIARIAHERVVLNADDELLINLVAPLCRAPLIWFSLQASNPTLQAARAAGNTVLFVRDETLWLAVDDVERELMPVASLPIAIGGVARHNIANALAAAGALHALGLGDGQIVLGLASFKPNHRDNPGRLNQFQRDGITVVMDYAHNSDGLQVLLASATPLKANNGKLWMIYSGTGDRTDEQIRDQLSIIGSHVDRLIIKREPAFLRGRPVGEMEPMMWEAAINAGLPREAIVELDGDVEAFNYAVAHAEAGDVVVFIVYTNRASQIAMVQAWEQQTS